MGLLCPVLKALKTSNERGVQVFRKWGGALPENHRC